MPDLSTTRMMNLLTLMLVTLPGLTYSFSYKRDPSELHSYLRDLLRSKSEQRGKGRGSLGEDIGVCCNMKKRSEVQNTNPELAREVSPWGELYKQLPETEYQVPRQHHGKYVCCNQPYTPPTPEISQKNMRSLILTLAKRDDREAPFRESWMEGRKRMSGVPSLPTLRTEGGSYTVSSGARRDPLLTGILSLLRSPSARRPASGFSSPQALASSAQDASRPLDFDASALVGKRGNGVITRIITGKRTFGELGGVNMDWE